MEGVFGCILALVILQVVSGQSSLNFFGAEATTQQIEPSSNFLSPLPSSTLTSLPQPIRFVHGQVLCSFMVYIYDVSLKFQTGLAHET